MSSKAIIRGDQRYFRPCKDAYRVFVEGGGSGFKRIATYTLRAGGHPINEPMGKLRISYLSGKQKWRLTEYFSETRRPSGASDSIEKVLGFFLSFDQAVEFVWQLIPLMYYKDEIQIAELKANVGDS